MHRLSAVYKPKQSKKSKYVGGFWCKWTTADEVLHWRKCCYGLWTHMLARSNGLKLKSLNNGFVSYKKNQLLASLDVNWWTGVMSITCRLLWCFYQLFGLSFWQHPFTADDRLVSKWCNATFLQIWWRNKHFQQFFLFIELFPQSLDFSCSLVHSETWLYFKCQILVISYDLSHCTAFLLLVGTENYLTLEKV